MYDFRDQKQHLLDRLERSGYISGPLVRAAMETVPREEFIPEEIKRNAYDDTPLSIGFGQTISAPHMNAMMCSALDFPENGPVNLMEIGAGSGYHAVLCAEMLRQNNNEGSTIYTIERVEPLGERARETIQALGYDDLITVILGDGTLGYQDAAPYDRILVTAAAPRIPGALEVQLAEGGILLIPVGEKFGYQHLLRITKVNGKLKQEEICGVAFVPLIGIDGFSIE
jgi:protein-L-isoaspartate(D-aspartate) O-methyltransferase